MLASINLLLPLAEPTVAMIWWLMRCSSLAQRCDWTLGRQVTAVLNKHPVLAFSHYQPQEESWAAFPHILGFIPTSLHVLVTFQQSHHAKCIQKAHFPFHLLFSMHLKAWVPGEAGSELSCFQATGSQPDSHFLLL